MTEIAPIKPVARRREWYDDIPQNTRFHTSFGFTFLAAIIVGFGIWANTALIAGAIVTTGAFVATGQNKTVQHLEGGVIRAILVKEGDIVEPGQPLLQLDETGPKAELRRLVLRHDRLSAIEARLRAEAREAPEVTFPQSLLAKAGDPDIDAIVGNQLLTFKARMTSLASDLSVLNNGIDAIEEKIKGSQIQLRATRRQLELFDQEIASKSILLKSGMIRVSEVLALQRSQASAQGEIGRLDGEIGDARERIARIREQITGARNTAVKTAMEQLHETLADQNDVRERMRAARSLLDRIVITAPVRGIVVKLRYHTDGGVVEPGKSIMELVPLHDELVIEARIKPQDIDHVRRGQSAAIRLTALSQRIVPMVSGEVVYLSADALPDDRRNQAVSSDLYVARIRLDPKSLAEVHNFSPTPGMPAEVYMRTTDRTFFEYIFKPLKDSMTRAFREI
jgi:HlyD family secretion protein